MPFQRQLLLDPVPPEYLLYDAFGDTLAAGAVNGSLANVPPGVMVRTRNVRTVTDTESKLSIANGVATFVPKTTPSTGNPCLWFNVQRRVPGGRFFMVNVAYSDSVNTVAHIGWDTNQSVDAIDTLRFSPSAVLNINSNAGSLIAVGNYEANTTYTVVVILRAVGGCFWLIKGGVFTRWTLLWLSVVGTGAVMYPQMMLHSGATLSVDNARVPNISWLPIPKVSDSFADSGALSTSDGLGHAEANGGAGVAWAYDAGCWAQAAGVASGTPTPGVEKSTNAGFEGTYTAGLCQNFHLTRGTPSELTGAAVHGGSSAQQLNNPAGSSGYIENQGGTLGIQLTAGDWVRMSLWAKALAGAGSWRFMDGADVIIGNATNAITSASWANTVQAGRVTSTGKAYFEFFATTHAVADTNQIGLDDNSVMILAPSSLIAVTPAATADVLVEAAITRTAGTQAGLCVRCDSQASPANFILAYLDGAGNVQVDKCVGSTWTPLQTTAVTYGAGKILRVICSGSAIRVYYDGAFLGAELVVSDAGILTNTLHGLFNTSPGLNTFDAYVCWARGTGNEYAALETM